MSTTHGDRRGSVLLPVVAAMLILALCGSALSELFAAHRYQSVIAVDSARAYWIAEAGLWHAAHEGTDLPAPVPHAGGSYTVSKSGDVYTSKGTFSGATRIVSREIAGTAADGPLDEPASESTSVRHSNRRFEIDLVSLSSSDLIIGAFSLSSDVGTEELHHVRLAGHLIWSDFDVFLPTGAVSPNKGSTGDRTIPAGASPTLGVDFRQNQSGTFEYTLVLDFTDGSSSTLVFTIDW